MKNKKVKEPPIHIRRAKWPALTSPQKIQDFLDKIPFNFEKKGETYMPPRETLRQNKAHCFEGAVLAAALLRRLGVENYLLDLKVKNLKKDSDHTVCAFKLGGYWGAISKTNHAVLRWRDPIYRDYRELALSYFHEYFLDSGEKTLASFSKPFDLWKKYGEEWLEKDSGLVEMARALDESPHIDFVPRRNRRFVRHAGKTEIKGAAATEWPNPVRSHKN